MLITLKRHDLQDDYTMGWWYINGDYFCDTLEDTDRMLYNDMAVTAIAKKKVAGQTAIPYGRYAVKMTFSARFQRILPLVCNVPCFDGVRIHAGNTAKDTAGCILLGERAGGGLLKNSRKTCEKLYKMLCSTNEPIWLDIEYAG